MIFGRDNELKTLNKLYEKKINEAVVFYGNADNNLSDIISEFLKNKDYFYYNAPKVSKECQLLKFYNDIIEQLNNKQIIDVSYNSILHAMLSAKCEKRVVVIYNFQNILKNCPEFLSEVISCLNDKWSNQSILFILVSENPYWVENQMVDKLGEISYELSGLIKVNDVPFIEFVRYFKNYQLNDLVTVYSIIGGRSKYFEAFDVNKSVKENLTNIISEKSMLMEKGKNLLPEELREPTVYNTLLYTMASGNEKLNDIHKATGFSRAKISVYINNLIDYEIIEKIDSFDCLGKDNAQKGIYRIKDRFISFYYRYIFSHLSELSILSSEKYYKKYIENDLLEFSQDAFRLVCVEYLMLLNKLGKLPFEFKEFGCFIGKVGNIDIVAEDIHGNNLIGLCNFTNNDITLEDYEWLEFCVKQAKLSPDIFYLFTKSGFDERLKDIASKSENIYLIDSTML